MKELLEFRRAQRRRNLSALTIHHRAKQLQAFSNWLHDNRPRGLLEATPGDIEDWLDSRTLIPATRGTYLSYLNAFYVWAVRTDVATANPVAKIDRPRRDFRLPRPTPDDDLALALAYAEERMTAWLLLSAFQGLRCIEIARLKVEDIDRQAMTLRIFGKGSREAVARLHPEVLAALDRYGLPATGFVFTKLSGAGQPLSPSTVSRYIGRHFHSLGSPATAHRNRAWFGTEVHKRTKDVLVTRDLLRHRTAATSEGYALVAEGRGWDVIGMLSLNGGSPLPT